MIPEIEKNIPIPTGGPGRPAKYPLRSMEVGDSFFTPTNIPESSRLSVLAAARNQRPKVFQTAKVEGGLRVWRVA